MLSKAWRHLNPKHKPTMNETSSTVAEPQAPVKRAWNFKDLTGQRFGRLVVVSFHGMSRHSKAELLCLCDCGARKVVLLNNLRNGRTTSCGCWQREATSVASLTHGLTGTAGWRAWCEMKRRCYNPDCRHFKNYGGRGIKVCERWLESFEHFLEDMGNRPSPEHSIDRHPNNDGDYEKSNCRWATISEQARNRRNNHMVTINGETKPIAAWSEIAGISQNSMLRRIYRKWPGHMLLLPKQKKGTKMRLP